VLPCRPHFDLLYSANTAGIRNIQAAKKKVSASLNINMVGYEEQGTPSIIICFRRSRVPEKSVHDSKRRGQLIYHPVKLRTPTSRESLQKIALSDAWGSGRI
jgi:hypothetical protein